MTGAVDAVLEAAEPLTDELVSALTMGLAATAALGSTIATVGAAAQLDCRRQHQRPRRVRCPLTSASPVRSRAASISVGGGIIIVGNGGATNAIVETGAVLTAGPAGHVLVTADHDPTIVAIAIFGSAGVVTLGADISVIVDSTSQRAAIGNSSSIPRAASVTVSATTDRDIVAIGLGGAAGAFAVAGSVALMLVSGDTVAEIGNVSVGSLSPVGSISVTANDDIVVFNFSFAIGAGVATAAAGLAYARLDGLTKATSGAHGSVSGGVTVSATGSRPVTTANVNLTFGLLAVGFTWARAENNRNTAASLNGNSGLSAGGARHRPRRLDQQRHRDRPGRRRRSGHDLALLHDRQGHRLHDGDDRRQRDPVELDHGSRPGRQLSALVGDRDRLRGARRFVRRVEGRDRVERQDRSRVPERGQPPFQRGRPDPGAHGRRERHSGRQPGDGLGRRRRRRRRRLDLPS